MSACHELPGSLTVAVEREPEVERGGASSSKRAEPHLETAQMGASRSVSPARKRREWRFLEARKLGDDIWYLSRNKKDGKVR